MSSDKQSAVSQARSVSGSATGNVKGGMVGAAVDVPYGTANTPEKQTQMTKDKVRDGIKEVMDLVQDGAGACVDRGAVVEQATKLERQADKIYEAIEKDTVFIEEVRHHHNRISDLCDNTRAYTQPQMVADLKRAAAIRVNVMTIVTGRAPEFQMEQEELDDLKSVRSMLRRKFGGKKTAKGELTMQEDIRAEADQSAMLGPASAVKADGVEAGFGAEMMTQEEMTDKLRGAPSSSGWATAMFAEASKA